MTTLKIGIIGCGGIAKGKHLPALAKQRHKAEMTAFCDIELDRAELAAKEYGTEEAKVYTDYKELLKDPSIDVVHVLTPNSTHAVITVAALEAGKHVMCEKPMAMNTAEAQQMLDAAKRTGKKLTIGYQNRFRADSRALYAACEQGDLGEVYFAKAHAIRRRGVPTWGKVLLVKKPNPAAVLVHKSDGVHAAAQRPERIEFNLNQLRIGMLQQNVHNGLAIKLLKLMKMVMEVKLNAGFFGLASGRIEPFGQFHRILPVTEKGARHNDALASDLRVIADDRIQIQIRMIGHVARDHLQAQLVHHGLQLRRRVVDLERTVFPDVMKSEFDVFVSDIRYALQRPGEIFSQRFPYRKQLQTNWNLNHVKSLLYKI